MWFLSRGLSKSFTCLLLLIIWVKNVLPRIRGHPHLSVAVTPVAFWFATSAWRVGRWGTQPPGRAGCSRRRAPADAVPPRPEVAVGKAPAPPASSWRRLETARRSPALPGGLGGLCPASLSPSWQVKRQDSSAPGLPEPRDVATLVFSLLETFQPAVVKS